MGFLKLALLASLASGLAAQEITPGSFAKLSLGLLYDQATVSPAEWGSRHEGLEKRAEFRLLSFGARDAVEYGVSKYRGTSTAYQRCRCKGFPKRSLHAIVSEFEEHRGGANVAGWSRLSGIYASSLMTMPFLPARYGVGSALGRGTLQLGVDSGFNTLNEFWPEIKRTLLFRKR